MRTAPRVKICGLTRGRDVRAAIACGADAIGFVFAAGSKRLIGPRKARELVNRVPAFVARVGLFLDQDAEHVRGILKTVPLSLLQFHGRENAAYCRQFGLPQPAVMGKVLGIVYRTIATHLTHKAGYTNTTAHTGAVTLIQRFGSALNLNIHFHMLFLDGVYVDSTHGSRAQFRWVKAPSNDELTHLTHTIAQRVARYLERQGLLVRDAGNSYLTAEGVDANPESPMGHLLGSSITYRIAMGPQQGRKVFTLQTLPDCRPDHPLVDTVGKVAGFSLHAGVATRANEREKLERLCRYIARPAVASKRLSLTRHGKVRYELKTPYNDGTTHVLFEPLDFVSKLAALVPKPRVHLTRFHGVFAPHSKYRARVTPTQRGQGRKIKPLDETQDQTPAERRASMTWAQRLKRVFNIDIETCRECGGDVRIIASIEDPVVIRKILAHLDEKAATARLPPCRGPPAMGLFD